MDPCECIWSHELAMRRLMSILRQGQAYCTDTECIDEFPGAPYSAQPSNFMMLALLFAFAVLMYMFRPNRNRNNEEADMVKNSAALDQDEPPPPPPSVN
uniref:Small integral membrane protein 14 n=1 Tax=Xenopsylla cheopis TaxID=163159 RepID=A0A6M2DK10_XENCH